jgi:beta-galactosidase
MWYIHKTQYDYANYFEANWKKDLEAMVQKDRNHPSVVMYSIGNEVSETAQKRGIALTEEMVRYLHELDERPVTCGINIFFNFLSSLGFGVYSDDKAKQEAAKAEQKQGKQKKKAVGSEFINNVAGLLGAGFMKFGATLHGSDVKTRDAFAKLDVAGYNYGVDRYKKDLKKYPNRVILGSETFCSDAATFYDLAQDHPALIGDFVWTGMDYLGEVGLGSWEYAAYAPTFEHEPGWITAGAGTLDLIGAETCQAAYTQVAFGLSPVRIGVIPVKFAGEKHSPAAWRMTNAVESWSWEGCNGMETTVEVYARGAEAALELNGTTLGKKKLPASGRVSFSAVYQPGTLTAVVYDEGGKEIARTSLQTAQQETQLTLCPEEPEVKADELCYVRLHYTDGAGTIKPLARGEITLQVEGAKLLAFGNACSYNQRGYLTDTSDTYYGQALAVLQPLGEGTITLQAQSPYGAASACIPCTAAET